MQPFIGRRDGSASAGTDATGGAECTAAAEWEAQEQHGKRPAACASLRA